MQWWKDCGLMERVAVAIEVKYRYGRRYIGFGLQLETDQPGGGPSEVGANSARWDSEVQRALYNRVYAQNQFYAIFYAIRQLAYTP